MNGSASFVGDVASYFLESAILSLFLFLLVLLVIRICQIRNPMLRRHLWGLGVVYPVVAPLIYHIVLPWWGWTPGAKLLESGLARPIHWVSHHPTAFLPTLAILLGSLFGLDVLRWLLCWLRADARKDGACAAMHHAQPCRSLLKPMAERLGLDRLPRGVLLDSAYVNVYSLPWSQPGIYLSANLAQLLDTEELRAMLAHEAAHLKHRDWIGLLVCQLCRDLLFFNPIIHLAYAGFLQAVEESADDLAVSVTRDSLALAACLIKVQTLMGRTGLMAGIGVGFVHWPTNLARRVARLLRDEAAQPCPRSHMRVGWGVAGIAIVLAGVL